MAFFKLPAIICALLLTCICVKTRAQAQSDDTTQRSYWASVGYGAGTFAENQTEFTVATELKNNWVLAGNVQAELDARKSYVQMHVAEVSTYNLLAGKLHHLKTSFFTTSVGLGVVHRNSFDTNGTQGVQLNETDENTIGVPITVQGFILPLKWLGLGLSAYVNLNTVQTIAGINFSIAIGKMGTR
ncbi:hypothetical protein KXQ82_08720 [Mucilaginibacter sp. HMF5004]|uniref:hypothetical protein n=1 Tax=Mucilaginibacter rivuli TaxID=2857527 RepID=UPI001C5F3637|nr:hypothetical protein [Mucilaginibacter rivuli]MBW4889797.1 hypothetical protein [Mucilaginibacter rivuli]